MFSITIFSFSQRVPIITISKYSKFGCRNNYIGDTNSTNRLMALIHNVRFCQGLLKHNLNRGIDMRLWLLFKPSLTTAFSACFIKLAELANPIKLCLAFGCPYMPLMTSGHKLLPIIRMNLASLINSPTFNRAKLLASFASISYILATLKAVIYRGIAPTSLQIASPRAIIRCVLPAIKGIKQIGTGKTILWSICPVCFVTHIVNIIHLLEIVKRYWYTVADIEEKYCEIAAKRCSQSVMRLEV